MAIFCQKLHFLNSIQNYSFDCAGGSELQVTVTVTVTVTLPVTQIR